MCMEVHYWNSPLLGVCFEVIKSLLVPVYFHCGRYDRGVTVERENGLYVVPYPEVYSVDEVSPSYFFGPIFGRHVLDGS